MRMINLTVDVLKAVLKNAEETVLSCYIHSPSLEV